MTLKKSKLKGLAATVVLGVPLVVGGCAEFYDDPLHRVIFGTMQELSPEFLQSSGWKEYKAGKKAEEERSRRIEEEVQKDRAKRAREEWEQSRVPKLIVYNKWYDLNKDGKYDTESELDGLGKRVFDLSKEELNVCIKSRGYEGKIVFQTWSSKNKLIGETLKYAPKNSIVGAKTGPYSSTEGDFLDNLKGAGPGEYVISATLDDGKNLYLPLTIIGAKNTIYNNDAKTTPSYNPSENKSSAKDDGFKVYTPKKPGTIIEQDLAK